MTVAEPAPAKINLALHVRGKLSDGRHSIETIFAFCIDGDRIEVAAADSLELHIVGPFANDLSTGSDNLVLKAASALQAFAAVNAGARIQLTKNLPLASGIGGGSADAAATLRALTTLWQIDPGHAAKVAPTLGADVPACLLSMTASGEGAGDRLTLIDDPSISGTPILLVNPGRTLSTKSVFEAWDGIDVGPIQGWRAGRNDLEEPARNLVPQIGEVIHWLHRQDGANFVRMSGSGATCFALFNDESSRDQAAARCPGEWWHLATFLR